jgi:hypothetical protein
MGDPQLGQNACARLWPLSAVFTYTVGFPRRTKLSAGAFTVTRKAVPVSAWQSVQWQMPVDSGSTSASKVIAPQWQRPSTRMTG